MNKSPRLLLLAGGTFAALALGGGVAYATTLTSPTPAASSVPAAVTPAAASADNPAEATTPETGAAADGPGGHADPAGSTVDHQFNGVE